MRATNTLDNIEGESLTNVDLNGNRRRSVDSPTGRRRERGVDLAVDQADLRKIFRSFKVGGRRSV